MAIGSGKQSERELLGAISKETLLSTPHLARDSARDASTTFALVAQGGAPPPNLLHRRRGAPSCQSLILSPTLRHNSALQRLSSLQSPQLP